MKNHSFHIITTGKQSIEEVVSIIKASHTDTFDVLHIREKHRTAKEIIRWYEELHPILARHRIFINDRMDAAMAVRAPGVQLGYTSVPLELARPIIPQGMKIGCSAHSPEEAWQAYQNHADYIMYGHIYETSSKTGLPPRGLASLAEIVEKTPLPVIAIGGITPDKVEAVLSTGCAGIAVMSSVFLHPQPQTQLNAFHQALMNSTATPRRLFI